MGPRGAVRRSWGDGIREEHDKAMRSAASGWRELCARRGTWAYVAALTALSAVAAFLPLADHLGYEFCEMVALCAGAWGAAPGIAAARLERSRDDSDAARALWRGAIAGVAALAIPVAIILLNGLRRPVCDPVGGLVLYLALPVP